MVNVAPEDHLDPTLELTLESVKKRAVSGVLALTGRTFLLQAIALVATFLLTVYLSPSQYGVFFLVSAVINFFAYFSDIGLAAALIQKKERLTREELKTTFTVQQGLVLLLLLTIFLATPLLRSFYGLSQEGVLLLWALGFSLFLSSLKTIPSILLERELAFNKLVIPQIVETLLFNIVAVYFAYRGFGITSFTYAVLARGFSGLVLIYILRPWKPGFAFAKDSLRSLLSFGIPYQANTFLAVFKDDGLIAFLGGILGTSGIGFLSWAQKWAFAPLRFFMDQVIKVTFPAFSRMQDSKTELANAVSKSIFFVCLLVFPSLVGLVIVAPVLVEIIPRYEKWQPALLALGLFSVNAAWASVTTPLTNLFNATGRIKTTFKLMVMWTSLTWLLMPVLALRFGVSGAALGSALVGTSSIVAIVIAKRHISFDIAGSVGKPLLAAFAMGIILYLARGILPFSVAGVVTVILIGIISYFSFIFLLVGRSFLEDGKKVFASLRQR